MIRDGVRAGWVGRGCTVQALLEGAKSGKLVVESGPHGDWTARLAEKLFGPKGPKITRS